ncbi:MAG: SEC-C domain-containing protein [Tatlockia sp.]|nr:SEC-C domain-containing protein [Tatlockia sp.]
MKACPCGSQNDYLACCGLLIDKHHEAASPEALMRSRYTAYTQAKVEYIKKTMRGKLLEEFDGVQTVQGAKQLIWTGLEVIRSFMDEKDENVGYVEFIANFQEQGKKKTIHELSKFQRFDGKWFYTEGAQPKFKKPIKKSTLSRNAPCPCGSQKKYKNCHGMTKK